MTSSEAVYYITSKTGTPSLAWISCTCVMDCNNLSVLLLFFGETFGLLIWFFWDLPWYLEWTKCPCGQYSLVHRRVGFFAQDLYNFGVLCLSSWMELWKIHNQTPHKIRVRRDQFLDLESEILILHEIVIYQYISLQESGVPTLLFQIYWLIFLHPRHKLDRPMCADFKW